MHRFIKPVITLTSLLVANTVISAPILFKDTNNPKHVLKASVAPQAVNAVIQSIQNSKPDSYKIIVYKNDNQYLIYTLSGKTWEAQKTKLVLDKTGSIKSLTSNYHGGISDLIAENHAKTNELSPVCPDKNIQFLVISAYPNVSDVNEAIKIVSDAAKKKYKTMTILSEDADGQTYKNWFSCPNLKGIYSVGHGSPNELLVGNGDVIDYDFFNTPEMKNKFKNTTVVLNSCLVYNYPIGSSIMYGNAMYASDYATNPGPNAFEYVGGHTSLLMYSSEASSACFIAKAIEGAKMDYNTLNQCIGGQDIHFQNFGLSHPGKYFDSVNS